MVPTAFNLQTLKVWTTSTVFLPLSSALMVSSSQSLTFTSFSWEIGRLPETFRDFLNLRM